MEATNLVANLKERDEIVVVFHDRLPFPEIDTLLVISEDNWKKLSHSQRYRGDGKGWLLIESDLFTLINSLKILERATRPLPNKFIINLTLLEIERYRKEWYISTVLNYVLISLKKLFSGKKV